MVNLNPLFPTLRGLQLLFSIIELGISGYTVNSLNHTQYSYYDAFLGEYIEFRTRSPSQVNFLLFVSIWTLLITPVLIALPIWYLPRHESKGRMVSMVLLGLDAVTMIFWLAGFAAVVNLTGTAAGVSIIQALYAMAIIEWLLFLATLILSCLAAFEMLPEMFMGPESLKRGPGSTLAADGYGGTAADNTAGVPMEMRQTGVPAEGQVHDQRNTGEVV